MRSILIAGFCAVLATSSVANTPLREVKSINDELLIVGLADQIRKNCDSISGRLLTAFFRLQSIHSLAKEMGYTAQEIKHFVNSKEEKDRLKMRGVTYLKENHATLGDPESMCALGRREIARKSAIGKLLYEK